MIKVKNALLIRKTHRYLGLFLGIQFLLWTSSGLYFSWTDIDEIHGDHFLVEVEPITHSNLTVLTDLTKQIDITDLKLTTILSEPFYWINNHLLIDAKTGITKQGVSEEEAIEIATAKLKEKFAFRSVTLLTEIESTHEYRGRPLPAYEITYEHPEDLKLFVSQADGKFQRVRFRAWRWFDFLWMTHIMDYDDRDNINNWLLRAFSILGLITVFSGFLLWYVSSPTVRKWKKK